MDTMKAERSPLICDRVRSQVSMRLDGELSQLELRMVDAHLRRCADCRAFEADVRSFTEKLRSAPLETLRQPVVVRRRRASFSAAQLSVAATLAVAALGLVSQMGVGEPERGNATGTLASGKLFKSSWVPEQEIAQLHDEHAKSTGHDRPGPISAI
jgi:predicted anti-sigma-YlaC factor YlaD